jgi:S1-C subfamily serine protease
MIVAVVKEALPRLRSGTAGGWIGVTTVPLSTRDASARSLSNGLVLTAITDDGPAHRAGLHRGDILIGFADEPASTLRDFYRHIRSLAPGTVLRLSLWRTGERVILPVEIGRRPAPVAPSKPLSIPR